MDSNQCGRFCILYVKSNIKNEMIITISCYYLKKIIF